MILSEIYNMDGSTDLPMGIPVEFAPMRGGPFFASTNDASVPAPAATSTQSMVHGTPIYASTTDPTRIAASSMAPAPSPYALIGTPLIATYANDTVPVGLALTPQAMTPVAVNAPILSAIGDGSTLANPVPASAMVQPAVNVGLLLVIGVGILFFALSER